MNALVECTYCEKSFERPHFNSKCCSVECKRQCRIIARDKYKKTEKGRISNKKWVQSDRCKENHKRYMQKPRARALAVTRATRCLKNNPHLQEKKRLRDIAYGKTEKGREINKIATSKYSKTEKGRMVQKNSRAKRRERMSSGDVSLSEWRGVLERHGNKCAYCKKKSKLELDHIYPLSKGGAHCVSNIQPLCRSCNAMKGAKIYGW